MIFETGKTFVGVDLAQLQDYSALAVVHVDIEEKETGPATGSRRFDTIARIPIMSIVHLDRWQQLPYRDSLEKIRRVLAHPSLVLDDIELIMDESGVGKPVVELAWDIGLRPTGITITGGEVSRVAEDGRLLVPRKELLSAVVLAYEQDQVKIPKELPLRAELEKELLNLQVRVRRSNRESIDSVSEHDDIAMALSLAVWSALNEFSTEMVYADRLGIEGGRPNSAPLWNPVDHDLEWGIKW